MTRLPTKIGDSVNRYILRTVAIAAAPVTALMLTLAMPVAPALAGPAPSVVSSATGLTCHASMTNSHPRDYTSTGVKVRTVPFAHIKTVAHYRTVNHAKSRIANAQGRRTVWYYISGATPGYKVIVDVYVSRPHRNGRCSTSFTPHR